jgi:hypothetical protein
MVLNSIQQVHAELSEMTTDEYDKIRYLVYIIFNERLKKIPGAPSSDDLIHDAFTKLLEGKRKRPGPEVTLITCIINIIRSLISHLERDIEKNTHLELTDQISSDTLGNISINYINPKFQKEISGMYSIVDFLIAKETQEEILAFFQHDEIVIKILELKFTYPNIPLKPIIILNYLLEFFEDITMKDVNNAKARLKNGLTKMNKQKGGECV